MSRILITLFFACCSTLGLADICDDINELANDWNEVANFVDECSVNDTFTDRELKTLENYIADLTKDTYGLADALIDLGDKRETRLGTNMRKTMAKLAESEDQDTTVIMLDKLVDILDKTVDYCDE